MSPSTIQNLSCNCLAVTCTDSNPLSQAGLNGVTNDQERGLRPNIVSYEGVNLPLPVSTVQIYHDTHS